MSASAVLRPLREWFDSEERREQRTEVILSIVIGALVGLVVVAFLLLTGRLSARLFPPDTSPLRRLVLPVIGSFVTGILLFRYFPEARGSGIPQTKFALFIRDGYMSLHSVVGKFLCCSGSLASGIALGREGPSVQIGAGIASVLARHFGLRPQRVRYLVPAGCAAALAAAFNTPIAAVLFSLEEILSDMHAPVLGSVVISSATSWLTLHLILGDEPLFRVPAYHLVSPMELLIYAGLGLAGGIVSVIFVKLLLAIRAWFRSLPASSAWIHPVAGGLAVGLLALSVPEVLGVGYDYMERVLGGDMAVQAIVILAFLKIIATAMSYSSGNAGGIFGPSLFIGAMTGGAIGSVAHHAFPTWTATPGAYALVGMGATFAGIIRTPLTSVMMIFEITRDYAVIVPLMISNLVSFIVSAKLQHEPIYEALANQEGIRLPGEEAREHISRMQISNVMRDLRIADGGAIPEVRTVQTVPLTSANRVVGVMQGQHRKEGDFESVYADQPLSLALERMGATGMDALPVVSRADGVTYLGTITLADALAAYGIERSGVGRE